MKKQFLILLFWFVLLLVVIAYARFAYAELTDDRITDENIGICGNHCWIDMRDRNLKEWKLEDHIRKVEVSIPVKGKQNVTKVETKITKVLPKETPFDLDKFTNAVARHETKSCNAKQGSALVNNCFGIRECYGGRCYGFKKYATKEDSYKAFKELWIRGYGGKFPTFNHAKIYSGNDRAGTWLANVTKFYNEQF